MPVLKPALRIGQAMASAVKVPQALLGGGTLGPWWQGCPPRHLEIPPGKEPRPLSRKNHPSPPPKPRPRQKGDDWVPSEQVGLMSMGG